MQALEWMRPRLDSGVRIIGYDPEPNDIVRKEWTVEDIDHGIHMASLDQAGLLFTRFNLELYFDNPEEEVWFRLRFT